MLKPRKVAEQEKQLSPELAAEREAVFKLFVYGQEQSAEYVAAAKAFNEKLRAAGLTSLIKVDG